jgi:membrane protein DedA with SNARE-associated domain
VLFGRLAAFPSTVIAAAAGASRMEPRRFLPADGLGGLLSVAEVLIAGYAFGAAYKSAGKGITVIGVIVFIGLLVAVGRWLSRET